jgi:hypothetical protein
MLGLLGAVAVALVGLMIGIGVPWGLTSIHEATAMGDLSAVKQLLAEGANVEAKDSVSGL